MKVRPFIKDIQEKASDVNILTREEILEVLRIPLPSLEAGLVMASAD